MRAVNRLIRSIVSLGGALLAISGCTHASMRKVTIEMPEGKRPPALEIRSVGYEASESWLSNVGTFAWGKYDEEDVESLRASFQMSAAPFEGPAGFRLHVIVRRVLIATTNNECLALACVAWAIESAGGTLIFHEQFYAWDDVRYLGTIGGVKDKMHEAIVRRVLQTAVRIATSDGPIATVSDPPGSSTEFETVRRNLPPVLSKSFSPLYLGGGYSIFIPLRVRMESTRIDWVRKPDYVDWPAYLRGK